MKEKQKSKQGKEKKSVTIKSMGGGQAIRKENKFRELKGVQYAHGTEYY